MKSKNAIMKYFSLLFLTFLSLQVFASGVIVTYSPDNPIAGQEVSFSTDLTCTNQTLIPGDGSAAIPMVNGSAVHTYSLPGNITPQIACNGTNQSFVSFQPIGHASFSSGIIIGAAPSPDPIPTLGEWALIILGIIIVSIGIVSLRSSKRIPSMQRS